ncbi:hypothetical protein A9Q81_11710 [Gammaproteobacteria bacterium 42_54_T18]|nr:hypothetical protein A9Q81_11710 [Gammaproteobacteria bacterium 42_54_T18]
MSELSKVDQRIEDAFEDISPQQAIFVREYVENGANGPAAAAKAKYCPKKKGKERQNGLNATASRLLNKKKMPRIAEAIAALQAKMNDVCVINTEWWLRETKKTYDKCSQAEEIEIFEDGVKKGSGEFKFDSAGATKCLDMMGKHLGVYAPEEKKHSVDDTLKTILDNMSGRTTGLPNAGR